MEIKDLILPDDFDKKRAKQELLDIYIEIYNTKKLTVRELFSKYAISYINELNEIENKKPNYNQEYCKEVNKLNTANFQKIGIYLSVYAQYCRFINPKDDYSCSISFEFNELELINKQYRLLQEIYYSRLSK